MRKLRTGSGASIVVGRLVGGVSLVSGAIVKSMSTFPTWLITAFPWRFLRLRGSESPTMCNFAFPRSSLTTRNSTEGALCFFLFGPVLGARFKTGRELKGFVSSGYPNHELLAHCRSVALTPSRRTSVTNLRRKIERRML